MKNKFTFLCVPYQWFLTIWIAVFTVIAVPAGFAESARATFAGGCYWCMEEAFEKVDGVISVTSGFEGEIEAVDIQFDPGKISYERLLDAYWRNVDPTDGNGQFCDRGEKYRSVIFYHDDAQRLAALRSKEKIEKVLNESIVTQVLEASLFSVAPEEDQDYYKKEPDSYNQYKTKCGRLLRLQELWKH